VIATAISFAAPDFTILAVLLALIAGYFWMLFDCIKKEPDRNQRVVWLVIILFVPLGFVAYFFIRKLRRPSS
jgi:RsiW-degrading membrane proteinase PrsW (M82 family)